MTQSKTTLSFWKRYADTFAGFYTSHSPIDRLFRRGITIRAERTLDFVRERPGASVLDLGCGPGRQVLGAINAGASFALGVDAAGEMLEIARREAAQSDAGDTVEYQLADILTLNDSRHFDLVWALGVFDYVPNPQDLLGVMHRHANSGGWVIGSFRRIWVLRAPIRKCTYELRGSPVFFYTRGRIRRLFEQAGLVDIRVEKIDRALYLAFGRKSGE